MSAKTTALAASVSASPVIRSQRTLSGRGWHFCWPDEMKTGDSPAGFSGLDGLPTQTWYHWGEMWLEAAVISVFGTATLAARHLIVLPLLVLAAASLTGTVVRPRPDPIAQWTAFQLLGGRADLRHHAVWDGGGRRPARAVRLRCPGIAASDRGTQRLCR